MNNGTQFRWLLNWQDELMKHFLYGELDPVSSSFSKRLLKFPCDEIAFASALISGERACDLVMFSKAAFHKKHFS